MRKEIQEKLSAHNAVSNAFREAVIALFPGDEEVGAAWAEDIMWQLDSGYQQQLLDEMLDVVESYSTEEEVVECSNL